MLQRAWRVDLAAGGLLALGVLTGAALISYDPADLPGSVYPAHTPPRNLLGLAGAWVARSLIESAGVAAYVWLAAWFVFVVMLFRRRDWLAGSLRLGGWWLLVPCVAVLSQRWVQPLANSPAPGIGGSLGAWLDLWLNETFPPPIGFLLPVACSVLAAALAVDLVWRRVLRALCRLLIPARRLVVWLLRGANRLLLGVTAWRSRTLAGIRVRVSGWRTRWREGRRLPPPIRTPAPHSAPLGVGPVPVIVPGLSDETGGPVLGPSAIPIHHPEPGEQPATSSGGEDRAAEAGMDSSPISNDDTLGGEPALALVQQGPGLYSERERFAGYELPPWTFLEEAKPFDYASHEQKLRERATLLEKTFADFGIHVQVVGINTGPVITMYEVTLETGLRVNKVTRMADDVALNLRVPSVRMVAPLPGKNAVGIEVPNEARADVRLKEVMLTAGPRVAKCRIPLFLGKDAEGRPLVHDLAEMPHLLIAGTTGTGKSVCLNAVILSMLMTRPPDEVKLILIDPKNGVEMEQYGKVPHLMHPIVTDMKKTEAILSWAVDKMEERYDLLRRARVRNIASYNELKPEEILRRVCPDEDERQHIPERMPYVVVMIDEMADLMMQFKKEVEGHIIRLAQKSRAAGIHLVVATQKPTVDVITGLIKSNLPSRICFKVSNKSDSRVVLDAMGADKLLGKGDMLFLPPGTSMLVRAQGTYASDQEIQQVTSFIESEPCYELELMQLKTREEREESEGATGTLQERLHSRDKLYEQAIDIVVREGRGSVSLLQRALGIGYGRASRLVDFMAQDGIVGGYNGSNAREVLYTPEQWATVKNGEEGGGEERERG
jgi:S-DNA-T family DNA segregation ATPase FtsK/SpoIIIE